MKKKSTNLSNYKFLGIIYYDKEGNSKLVEPHPHIKREVEKRGNAMLDEMNKNQ